MGVKSLLDLTGRASITGGSRGLGLKIAEALGEIGAKMVKGLVVLLASQASDFMTGQVVAVDGGVTLICRRHDRG